MRFNQQTNTQVAHLTSARPPVDEIAVHSSDLRGVFAQVLLLLGQLGAAVDAELVPPWFRPWAAEIGRDLYADDYFVE
jgi:hypothetical protein